MNPRHVAPFLSSILLLLLATPAAALVVERYDEQRWTELADCTFQATLTGTAATSPQAGMPWRQLLLDHPQPDGPCAALPTRIGLPDWLHGHSWPGAPALVPGQRYRIHAIVLPDGTHSVLGLSTGIRPVDDAQLLKFNTDNRGPDGAPLRWPRDAATFRLHSGGSSDIPFDALRTHVRDSLRMWSAPDCSALNLVEGPTFDDPPDWNAPGNSIAFWEDEFVQTGGSVVIAFTSLTYNEQGQITAAFIRLNGADRSWSVDGALGTYDVRGVLAHELGHAIGLAHTPITEAVMFRHVSPSRSITNRVFDEDDVDGLCFLYPCPDDDCAQPFPPPNADFPDPGADVCAPCADNASCGGVRDLCLFREGASEGICSRECREPDLPCPTGFSCTPVADGSGGAARQCTPEPECPDMDAVLCEPCTEDDDCGPGNRCIPSGDHLACATSCADGIACPAGYLCQLLDAPAHGEYCVPLEPPCPRAAPPASPLPRGCGNCAATHEPPAAGWAILLLLALLLRRHHPGQRPGGNPRMPPRRSVTSRMTPPALLLLAVFAATAASAVLVLPSSVSAQAGEWTRADRLAVLYSPQLRFADSGEPLVTIGIADGETSMRIAPTGTARILPAGTGGPEIHLPEGHRFTVTIRDGQPGVYQHHVVLASFRPAEREALREEQQRWESLGHDVQIHQLGSIFAVRGQSFDTRTTILTTGETGVRSDALALAESLEREHGLEARLHSILDEYPGGTIIVRGLPGGMEIRARDILRIEPDGDSRFRVDDIAYDRGTHMEGTETREFVGSLILTADRDGALSLINELPVERAVAGILPAEIYASAPAAALRAQAVAARSELFADFGVRHLSEPWMTCADQRCQVYRGVTHEDRRTTRAVADTRGVVVVDGDRIINAYFSANNGGFAGMNSTTWGGEQRTYLPARYDGPESRPEWANGLPAEQVRRFLEQPPDAYAAITSFGAGRTFRWTHQMTRAEVDTAVHARYPDVGTVVDMEVTQRDASGRATRLRIEGTRRTVVVERELNIRRTLGGLRSALFVMDIERSSDGRMQRVTFTGGGFGHGVGLCQSGSIGAAERGMEYRAILQNYYPGTALRQLF